MKSLATNSTLVFSFLLFAVFGFGQTEQHLQTTFDLDLAKLAQSLKSAPDFAEKSMHQNGPAIELPMPDGAWKTFRMFRTHPMHPVLEAKYPEILTYHGKCYEDGVSGVSVTISPKGLKAMIVNDRFERIFIEPEGGADPTRYVSMFEPEDAMANFKCSYHPEGHKGKGLSKAEPPKIAPPPATAKSLVNSPLAMGDKLRTYRMAMPCTGEFAQENGGTKPLVLAVMAANVNAVNLIYIREMAIKFELVANNDDVIYLDGNTDPFLNDGQIYQPPMVDDLENCNTVCNTVIGPANYDIGHLGQAPPNGACNGDPNSGTSGCGGWAGAGPCVSNFKASGMSVNSIGILIHEIGHQFWMPHPTDADPPNRYEHIAIAKTIMGRNDALPGSSDYFHVSSTDLAAAQVEDPGHCVPGVATNNTIPTVAVGTGGMHIPKGTPFILSGSATDPDPNTTLVYNWQQYNNDTTYNIVNHRLFPVGNAPIFRNYFPTVGGNVRTIPRLEDLLNDTIPFGLANCDNMGNNCDTMDLEGLPTYSRNLTFRLVARDFEPTGGAFDYATLSFEVDGNSGPFKVTAPNTAVTWTAGTNANITWDVANTNNAPVNCATVDIFLSLDGGYTYPITIATGTPNDGSHTYAVPSGFPSYTTARVKIECATYENVVFFDISNENFTITGPCVADAGIITPADTVTAAQGSPSLDLNLSPYYGPVTSTPFSVAGTGIQTQAVLKDTAQVGCWVGGCCPNYYNTVQFQVNKTGTYTFVLNWAGGGQSGFFSVHAGNYDPMNMCTGFITSNYFELPWPGGLGGVFPINGTFVPGTTYTMVFHPWIGQSMASGTVSFSNNVGGHVMIGPGGSGPGANYGYTYAAFNTANGQIAAISSTANFTSLPAGTYEVYGVSYRSANPPPDIVNPNDFLGMTRLQVQLSTQCIVFSENHVYMVVQPGACTPPSVSPPLVTQPTCSTPGTIAVGATGNGTLEYTVDDGINWSTNGIFSGLAPGNYIIKARLQADPTCIGTWIFNPVVLNAPSGCTPSIAIAATDANKPEGNAGPTPFTFTVTRTGAVTNQTTANWAVTGSGANPANGADFTGGNFPNGTVTFPAGSMAAQTITVNVNGDLDVEPDEGFTVTLSNPVNATITTAAANGTILNDDAAAGYCAAGATSTGFEKISNVQFSTINNPSTSTAGYEDFTAVTTTVQQGSTHAFTGTISNPFASDQIIVWIDYNQDLDFDDPGEQVFLSPTGVGPHSGNITIPANAMTGNTRMRVRLHDTGDGPNTTPCGNSTYGQVEDYTINITAPVTAAETLDFDGTDDYVALPANLTTSLTNFTFEAWVFWDGATNWQRIMDFGVNTDIYMYLTPQGAGTNNPIFAITTSSSGGEERIISSVAASVGQWQHYAVVLDAAASTGTLYIDGAQVGQNTNMTLTPADLGNLPNNYLGKAQFFFDPYFDGKLDEVRLWNFAKTASQVACQKDAELTGTEPGLLAYYNFNQGFANSNNPGVTTLDDLTANNNDGTLTNFALTGNGSNWTEPGAPVMGTPSCCPAGNVIYVNDDATGANNGTSWTNAFNSLQDALAATANCPGVTQIWVAAGTYKPTTGTDRTISFNMKNNLAIYGGFIGTETLLSERNWFLNITVLSGDIGTPGDNSDNSYHVVRNENINNTAILDGFRITSGNANGTGEYLWGGGIFNINNASPTIKQCGIIENNAQEGGGMANRTNSSPSIINCGISFNHAITYKGGGIYNENSSSPVIVNTIFRGNTAAEMGGAIYNTANCNPELMNCTLVGNSANAGGVIASFGTSANPVVTNSIFWNNTGSTALGNPITFSYSLLQDAACPVGHTCGAGMIYNIDPLFVSPTDAHLQACSPAKDVGTATGAPATDFDGDARPQGAGFDMGFDENGETCSPCPNTLAVPGTIASGIYEAAMDLTSDGLVQNGAVVTLKAGNSITLEANFEVQVGGVLETVMEGCVPFAPPAEGN